MTALILRAFNTETGVWDALTYRAYFSGVTHHEIARVWLADAVDADLTLIGTTKWETASRLTETIKTSMGRRAAHLCA